MPCAKKQLSEHWSGVHESCAENERSDKAESALARQSNVVEKSDGWKKREKNEEKYALVGVRSYHPNIAVAVAVAVAVAAVAVGQSIAAVLEDCVERDSPPFCNSRVALTTLLVMISNPHRDYPNHTSLYSNSLIDEGRNESQGGGEGVSENESASESEGRQWSLLAVSDAPLRWPLSAVLPRSEPTAAAAFAAFADAFVVFAAALPADGLGKSTCAE